VAWNTLCHLPPDILASGAAKARLLCDHPSKIVPTIIAETADRMRRRETYRSPSDAPRLAPPDYVSAEEAAKILAEFGLKRGDA
jgi:hypothetical protein